VAGQDVKAVPGIPLAALDAIADDNVRDVLRAVVDGWHTRNGASGSGGERFVTAAEMGLATGRSAPGGNYGPGGGSMGTRAGPGIGPGDIARIINDLQAQVMESPLFKALGLRVDLIDKPGAIFDRLKHVEIVASNEVTRAATSESAIVTSLSTLGARVGTAEAALQSETTLRVNADNALATTTATQFTEVNRNLALAQSSVTTLSNSVSSMASSISQVQAAAGANTVAVQSEATARANADGSIGGKLAWKIDANGYVSGFGLISEANNSTPFSDFIVRADRFSIGSPSGPGITPKVPFIVTTTPTTLSNGTILPAGVYIDQAMIKNAVIGSANIGLGEIDTLRIRGNAVTVPFASTFYSTTTGTGFSNVFMVAQGTIVLDSPGMVYAASTGLIAYGLGWCSAQTSLTINGVTVSSGGGTEAWVNAAHSGGIYCDAGTVVVQLYFQADNKARIINPSLFIQGAKR
jgi:hypothetical protein